MSTPSRAQVLRRAAPLGAVLALWVAAACAVAGCNSEPASTECNDVCQREAQCMDERNEGAADTAQRKFDRAECVAACNSLLRDREGKKLVASHVACVNQAQDSCDAVLACE